MSGHRPISDENFGFRCTMCGKTGSLDSLRGRVCVPNKVLEFKRKDPIIIEPEVQAALNITTLDGDSNSYDNFVAVGFDGEAEELTAHCDTLQLTQGVELLLDFIAMQLKDVKKDEAKLINIRLNTIQEKLNKAKLTNLEW